MQTISTCGPDRNVRPLAQSFWKQLNRKIYVSAKAQFLQRFAMDPVEKRAIFPSSNFLFTVLLELSSPS